MAALDAPPAGVSSRGGSRGGRCMFPRWPLRAVLRRLQMPHLPFVPASSANPQAAASKAGHMGAILLSPKSCQQQREQRRGQRGGPPATRLPPAGPRHAWRLASRPPRGGHRLSSFLHISMLFLNLHSVQDRVFFFFSELLFFCELFEIVFLSQIFGDD